MRFESSAARKIEPTQEEYIESLAERVKKQMDLGYVFTEACRRVFEKDNLGKQARKKMMSEIGSILGRRGAQRKETLKAKAFKKEKPGGVFTREQLDRMKKESELLRHKEERRAGQSYEESDIQ